MDIDGVGTFGVVGLVGWWGHLARQMEKPKMEGAQCGQTKFNAILESTTTHLHSVKNS